MTIKSLFFCLFLYVCLAWVGAELLRPDDLVRTGLLWTAVGLIAVLALIIGARLIAGLRLLRAKVAARPAAAPKPAVPVHPDDAAMMALIAEANGALAKSQSFAGTALSSLHLYLLVGPEGSGKTSTFLNSGMEPELLAGDGTALANPTRLCNLWLAQGAIFAELGGRVFAGEVGRWSALLGALRGQSDAPLWRRLWREPEPQMNLRGVIAFCDSKELTGASSDPQRLERYNREWQERLRAITDKFGTEFPVYMVITKCDKIPFFSDFFRRLHPSEAGQVLGCTLPVQDAREIRKGEVFAEAEAKRLTASFRPLYQALARRRVTHLAHEPNPAQRPGVYEFPRELKRIRSPLVQFLTDVFRPNPLGPAPILRGYYLTGVREIEGEVRVAVGMTDTQSKSSLEATGLFRADATQLFQTEGVSKALSPGGRKSLAWMFVSDLFHRVILPDQLPRKVLLQDSRFSQYRKAAFASICAVCALLCLAFFVSWVNNRNLLSDVENAARLPAPVQGKATLRDLQALEALRVQVANLEDGHSWSYRWGLYTGNQLEQPARTLYFHQFQRLLLNDLNDRMADDLRGLSSQPDTNAPYERAYSTLRAHLMITAHNCGVESAFAAHQLKQVRAQIAPGEGSGWQKLADSQIDFYARELPQSLPVRLAEDKDGIENARQYLRKVNGIDKIYVSMLAQAEKTLSKTTRLQDLAPTYTAVLSGPSAVRSVFSPAGWAYMEKASKDANIASQGEACVLGTPSSGMVGQYKQNSQAAQQIQRLFLIEYVEQWRQFVAGFSVLRYSSAADAARKLELLSDRKSPLLAVFFVAANQTNFPPPAVPKDPNVIQKGFSELGGALKKGEAAVGKATGSAPTDTKDALNSPTDIPRYFQPVHVVEPPGNSALVVEKNGPYVEALAQLQKSMQEIALKGSDPAVHQAAAANYDKALETARQLTRTFNATGIGSLDDTVSRLLESPIKYAERFIERDPGGPGTIAKKINGELQTFCKASARTFTKYPFKPDPTNDATLAEFESMFNPVKGSFWLFQQQSLADLVVKEGSSWKVKDPAKKPVVTTAMLNFLNATQGIASAFYLAGPTRAQFTYSLLPKLDEGWSAFALELELDGQPFTWLNKVQHPFTWPSQPDSKTIGARVRLRNSTNTLPVASQGGIWGIFRVFGDAEPRDLNVKAVQWKYFRSGLGRSEPIVPPVDLQIVAFPGQQDVFNPKFWEGLRCPATAVQ